MVDGIKYFQIFPGYKDNSAASNFLCCFKRKKAFVAFEAVFGVIIGQKDQ